VLFASGLGMTSVGILSRDFAFMQFHFWFRLFACSFRGARYTRGFGNSFVFRLTNVCQFKFIFHASSDF